MTAGLDSMDGRTDGVEVAGSWWQPGEDGPRVSERVRYAVVGLGPTSQTAILPAFSHARSNSELAALISGDPEKLQLMGRKYRIKNLYDYHGYEDCLASGDIDAVYIALPNNQHREFTVRAARAGVHVLCEMPMAVDSEECEAMQAACRATNIKLMVGNRLHFEEANVRAMELVRSGRLGDLRTFHATFTVPLNARGEMEINGGPLLELGTYCVHAARYVFDTEPVEVAAMGLKGKHDARFLDAEESCSAILRFPGDRVATLTCSRRAGDVSYYEVHGTEGCVRLDHAFSLNKPMLMRATVKGRTREKTFRKRDQFAPELQYFSECILGDRDPEASALTGVSDIRVIEALRQAMRTGQTVTLATPASAATTTPRAAFSFHEPTYAQSAQPHA